MKNIQEIMQKRIDEAVKHYKSLVITPTATEVDLFWVRYLHEELHKLAKEMEISIEKQELRVDKQGPYTGDPHAMGMPMSWFTVAVALVMAVAMEVPMSWPRRRKREDV